MTIGPEAAPTRIDTGKPHPARVYDWWLGGKDNYPDPEDVAAQAEGIVPVYAGVARKP